MFTVEDYRLLAALKPHIRWFGQFNELTVRGLSPEPCQHQLALGLKGLPRGKRPRIAELAERLPARHHSTVEVVNRLAPRGYLRRQPGGENDRREAFLTRILSAKRVLGKPSLYYPAELRREVLSCPRPSGE